MEQTWFDLLPRKRRMPLKRYKVRAILPDEDTIFLVVRARSKKNAKFLTLQDYDVIRVEVVEVLGRSNEQKLDY